MENLHERVEQLARMTVLSDPGDLAGLVALQEQATALAAELGTDHADAAVEMTKRIGELAEAIVLRSVEDADAAFLEIGKTIDRLLTVAADAPQPVPTTAAGCCKEDQELVAAWISGTESMLADLEGRLLQLDKAPGNSEAVADIRRILHTIKGECGVLSLHGPQRLCHEAESLIDACADAGRPLAVDPVLQLLDWLRTFVQRLSRDPSTRPEGMDKVAACIQEAQKTIASETGLPEGSSVPAATPTQVSRTAPTAAPATQVSIADADAGTLVSVAAQPGTEENLSDFLCEARDHLAASEEALLTLDRDPTDQEQINKVFRAFHTIKGVAGFMALKPIVSLAHSAEQLLDAARSRTLTLRRGELDLILASCDMMGRLLGVLEGKVAPLRAELASLVAKLDAAASGKQAPAATQSPAQTLPAHAIPESSGPTANPLVEAAPVFAAALPSPAAPSTPPVDSAKYRRSDQTVKVSTSRMDSLVNMVGELVIAQQMVVQEMAGLTGQAQKAQRTLGHMSKMVRELQEVSMSLRMVNLKGTFQKMTRLVRDVSQKAGKQIEVVTEGEEVELDRNVVEAITDPLVHMIRNACDHGVEGPDERRAAGKPPTGVVRMRAYHAGGSIVIEIADDGRGLRREKLLAKARSKNLFPADFDESAMSDSDVFALILLPSFSTAEKVTDISGRGVGMDVVKRNIEALRGKIEIRSTPGAGTTFLLRLPLTMAIIDGMVVRVGDQRYVVPTLSIQQSFRPRQDEIKTIAGGSEMINVRGSMLPVYRLDHVFDRGSAADPSAALLMVVESHDKRYCMVVDEIIGQQQVVIKTLSGVGRPIEGVSGGAILGDGRVALILDVGGILNSATSTAAAGV